MCCVLTKMVLKNTLHRILDINLHHLYLYIIYLLYQILSSFISYLQGGGIAFTVCSNCLWKAGREFVKKFLTGWETIGIISSTEGLLSSIVIVREGYDRVIVLVESVWEGDTKIEIRGRLTGWKYSNLLYIYIYINR